MAEIWIFGNQDVAQDALPVQLMPRLQREFTQHRFTHQDPLDEWEMPDPLYLIDTVEGVNVVSVFTSLDAFQQAPHVTMHDFDLGTQLQFMNKLGKLPKQLFIFGIPSHLSAAVAYDQLVQLLRQYGL
ncbi:MAG: hypothetical protein HZC01_04675 [Candidatus Kerfeldbacteria bacterium]|nr:hypothetical protein [Candidatus Kerfeldbacteria bacterium]